MNAARNIHYTIVAALLVGMGFIALNFLRLAFIANIVHPFLLLNMAVLFTVVVIGMYYRKRLTFHKVEWAMLGCLVLTALCTNYADRLPADIAVDVLRPLLFILAVATIRSLADITTLSASPTIRRALIATMWLSVIAVVACYAISNYYHVLYPAYSTIDALFGLGWLAATSSPVAQFLYVLVLLVSAKRGVYLAAFIFLCILYRRNRVFLGVVIPVIATLLATLIVMTPEQRVTATAFFVKSYINQLQKVVKKPDFDAYEYVIDVVSGGRVDEARDALQHVTSKASYVVGEGFGFSYPSKQFAPSGAPHRNLHFTPLSIIIYYGGVFFALFVWYLVPAIRAAWSILNDRPNPVMFTYATYFFASLVFCLTEYSVFVYANFAVSCGLMMAYGNSKKATPASIS